MLRSGIVRAEWRAELVNCDFDNPLRPRKGMVPIAMIPYREVLRLDPCVFCNAPGGTLEHIQPKARRGSNSWPNLASACCDCNMSKGADTLLGFLMRRAGLVTRPKRPDLPTYRTPRMAVSWPHAPAPKVINPILGKRGRRRLPAYW